MEYYNEEDLSAKQREELPDSAFGIPELRKFPLTDRTHVIKAKQFFKHCPDQYKASLRQRINKKAKELGVEPMNENLDQELNELMESIVYDEATIVNKFKKTMTLYNADTRPADVLYPRHPSAGNRLDKQSGNAVFFFSTQEEAIKYVVGKGLAKEYMEYCEEVNTKLKAMQKSDPEKAKRIRTYIAQINKFTEGGKYPPVFRKIGVHMKYFGMDDKNVFPEFPFCSMFIDRAKASQRKCYIRICNVPTEKIKHGHCANYKEFTVFEPCKVDKMLTFTLGQLFSKIPVSYFTKFDDFRKFLPTITKNFDKDLFRGLISYSDFRKRLQWEDGKKNHEQLNNIDTGEEKAKNESYDILDEELEELFEDVLYDEGIKETGKKAYDKGKKFYEKHKEGIHDAKDFGKSVANGAVNGVKGDLFSKAVKHVLKSNRQNMYVSKKDIIKSAKSGAAWGAAMGAAEYGLKKWARNGQKKKAKEVAKEEGCTLEEAFEYVYFCEQILLDEGYTYDEIYNEEDIEDEFEDNENEDIEYLNDAAYASYMDLQKSAAGKVVNKIFKKRRDKVRNKVAQGKKLNSKEQELYDRMQAIQNKRRETLKRKREENK